MSGFNDLYQEVILHHNKSPRNYGVMEAPDAFATGHNPLCGDKLVLFLAMDGEVVMDVRFEGDGCAISKASASVMTDVIKGKTVAELERLYQAFHALVVGEAMPADAPELGKLEVFSGVSEFPARVKCASLAWHTLQAALKNSGGTVTTE